MSKSQKVNNSFMWTVILLVVFGFTIFYSASTGLAARGDLNFHKNILDQLLWGIALGFVAMFIFSKIDHNIFKKYGMLIFIGSLILTFLVFIPGLGIEHGGSTRWLNLKIISFQPSEILKVASIIFIASWFNFNKKKLKQPYFAILSVSIALVIISIPLIFQKDFDIIFLIAIPLAAMYFVAKAPWKTGLTLGIILILLATIIAFSVPYIKSRIIGYINPSQSGQTINYQAQQSQIAIGSGGLFGKGFGQSTQKFGLLPEPTKDSIFAVLAEEFGLLGSVFLLSLYFLFAIFGYKIASRAQTMFGSLFVFGIITIILIQSLMNIASMVGLFPITGQPLVFVSHGGTSLLVTLSMMGIILNISKTSKSNQ